MADKLLLLAPELLLFAGAMLVAVMGLSRERRIREMLPLITAIILGAGAVTVLLTHSQDLARDSLAAMVLPAGVAPFVKIVVCLIGIVLVMLGAGTVDRKMESDVAAGRIAFDPLRASRGEYHAFFLLSLIGVMLCTHATDLIWLFVALELTSLPTYIMVAISRPSRRAQEASMKYFFLGALSAAIFLYGFALLYGATGTVKLIEMRDAIVGLRASGLPGSDLGDALGAMGSLGAVMVILGIGFKIAAAPMHFYAADVYEGAASAVTAFLGFVPKTAGMIALMGLLATFGWDPAIDASSPVGHVLWMLAVLTMTLGNIGALLQKSVKRTLAYSSIAHSGYLLIGLLAGPGLGYAAVLFYLLSYGLMNTGAFAVLAGLERQGREIESMDEIAGLSKKHPAMAWALALCCGSLLGFPPLLGFIGKLLLFIAGVQAGMVPLVVIAGLNSAISGWYYLQLIGLPILKGTTSRSEVVVASPSPWPRVAALGTGVAVAVLPLFAQPLIARTELAAGVRGAEAVVADEEAAASALPAEADAARIAEGSDEPVDPPAPVSG
jgi:NADH-quinone oxidoreductase subunit N